MTWIAQLLDRLAQPDGWGYRPGAPPAAETMSIATLALLAHHRPDQAALVAETLTTLQNDDGSLGVLSGETSPGWPTAWGLLAWIAATSAGAGDFGPRCQRALAWIVSIEGTKIERNTDHVAHDTTLVGWPWVAGTHSWMEPTAACVLALRGMGAQSHPRAREAVRLLVDRLLPAGGCNYGNTAVLGQTLRPHLEPSGLVLLALSKQSDPSGRLPRTIGYVRRAIGPDTTAASLSYGLMGLAAHGETLPEALAWLERAAQRTEQFGAMLPRLALCALAAAGESAPLVRIARGELQWEPATA